MLAWCALLEKKRLSLAMLVCLGIVISCQAACRTIEEGAFLSVQDTTSNSAQVILLDSLGDWSSLREANLLEFENVTNMDEAYFRDNVCLLVVSKAKGSSGHWLSVIDIRVEERELVLVISEGKPGRVEVLPEVIWPFALVGVRRDDLRSHVRCEDKSGRPWPAKIRLTFQLP